MYTGSFGDGVTKIVIASLNLSIIFIKWHVLLNDNENNNIIFIIIEYLIIKIKL